MRGKVHNIRSLTRKSRITPACAGKSGTVFGCGLLRWDHPRVCGEKLIMGLTQVFLAGSPPRVRGKVNADSVERHAHGITPACAGKRDTGKMLRNKIRDHPRVCGEKQNIYRDYFDTLGSPPRVRGKALLAVQNRL